MEQSTSEQTQDHQFDFGYSDSETESDPGPDDFHRYYKLYKILHMTLCLHMFESHCLFTSLVVVQLWG